MRDEGLLTPRLRYADQILKGVGPATYSMWKTKAERRKKWQAAANQSSEDQRRREIIMENLK